MAGSARAGGAAQGLSSGGPGGLFRQKQLAVLFHPLFPGRWNAYSDFCRRTVGVSRDKEVTMNTRSFFTLVTAATAVAALAAGMLLAISAPAPAPGDFGPALMAAAEPEQG